MNQYLGMFYARDPRALQGVCDAPYHICGRHALCARQSAGDGGALALVCGRVRNARALREELSARGLKPQPGDSGLLLAAWRMWGEACVRRIEGAAQLIVIDQDARRLLLAADRMGEAGPLFYAAVHKSIVFANHPAPLLEAPGVARVIDQDGLRELFGLGPARTPGRTPLRDVFQLPPGHMLLADEDGHRVTRYFRLEARPHEDSPEKTVETVRALLDQALSEAAPLSPACMLSGGLDSTALTALLTQIRGEPARTFSVDYEENDRHFSGGSYQPEQDAPYVAEAVRALGCEHTRVVLPVRSLADALEDAVIARGFPGMADIDSSLMLFSREIAPSGRYVISGECGDEVFGGYPWFNREELICAEGFPWSGSLALRESVLNEPVRRALNLPAYVEGRYQEAVARQSILPRREFPRRASASDSGPVL